MQQYVDVVLMYVWYEKMVFELFLVIVMIITSEKENSFSLKIARVSP